MCCYIPLKTCLDSIVESSDQHINFHFIYLLFFLIFIGTQINELQSLSNYLKIINTLYIFLLPFNNIVISFKVNE